MVCPRGLKTLLLFNDEDFFKPCTIHDDDDSERKLNEFCFRCCVAFCSQCDRLTHKKHRKIKIIMKMKEFATEVGVIGKYLNQADSIQTFQHHNDHVIFLKNMPKTPDEIVAYCKDCEKPLSDGTDYCSLMCLANDKFKNWKESEEEDLVLDNEDISKEQDLVVDNEAILDSLVVDNEAILDSTEPEPIVDSMDLPPPPLPRRRRKGAPRRSPLQ